MKPKYFIARRESDFRYARHNTLIISIGYDKISLEMVATNCKNLKTAYQRFLLAYKLAVADEVFSKEVEREISCTVDDMDDWELNQMFRAVPNIVYDTDGKFLFAFTCDEECDDFSFCYVINYRNCGLPKNFKALYAEDAPPTTNGAPVQLSFNF